jgi:hypothetical protein
VNPNRPAVASFLLALTALLLPWWRVAWDDGLTTARDDVAPFRPEPPLTTEWGPWLTGALAAAAALLLFIRVAGGSRTHEPHAWRRDLAVAAGLLAAAVLSCLLWPAAVPSFWGGRTYALEDGSGPATTETAMPGLGWWLALLATLAAAVAAWGARRETRDAAAAAAAAPAAVAAGASADPSTAADTTRK